jgi:hypothetical protein
MFFVGIRNILEVEKLNNEQIKSELKFGFKIGAIAGTLMAIFALLVLNVWYILPPIGAPDFWAVVVIWMGVGFSPTILLYKSLLIHLCYPRSSAFFTGLVMIVGLISYAYNILAYDILPYSLLRALLVVLFVIAGISLGLTIKIIVEPKMTKEEIAQ